MNLKPSKKCCAFIREFEGFRDRMYICDGKKKTIGYGHVIIDGETFSNYMSEADARKLLNKDIDSVAKQVMSATDSIVLAQHQFDALVSLTFNIGIGNLKKSTLLKRVLDENHEGVLNEICRYIYANHRVIPGLMLRRKIEAKMYSGKLGFLAIDKVPEYIESERDKMKKDGKL